MQAISSPTSHVFEHTGGIGEEKTSHRPASEQDLITRLEDKLDQF